MRLTAHFTSASDTEHLLTLRVHHIEADGWSIDVVEADLQELYAAAIVRCPPLPFPRYQCSSTSSSSIMP